MAGQAPQTALVGLNALKRDLAKLTSDQGALNKAFAAAGQAAATPVAATARANVPQVSGRLASSIRVRKMRSGAGVAMGSSSVRWAGWVEFGGTRRAPHRSTRPYDPRGRYLFPAGLVLGSTGAAIYAEALTTALAAVPWTNETTDPAAVHD
jgi:hypothetical protein